MTTRDLPEAAVSAAHAAADACSYSHRPDGPWACCTTAALTAALPHLGDTIVQFGVQYRDTDGDTMTMQCSSLIDADGEVKTFDAAAEPTVVYRPRITGPWRPWTGGTR